MSRLPLSCLTVLAAACLAGGCGGSKSSDAKVTQGAVVYRDALDDNHGNWFTNGQMRFDRGLYLWQAPAAGENKSPVSLPDALLSKPIPAGLAISATVEVQDGDALRVLACREQGPRDAEPTEWYELGIDGRQALIRRMAATGPPKVLAREKVAVPNGKRVRLTGQCVPDGDRGLVLALQVDGNEVVRARDSKPLPASPGGLDATPSIRAYTRPDSKIAAAIAWDDFEVRKATVATP